MGLRPRRKSLTIQMKTFEGKSGKTYLVFLNDTEVHVFTEVGAKAAAVDCGGSGKKGVWAVKRWQAIWDS